MNALVTGGYGFIGSHLVDRLLKEKFSLAIIDNQTHVCHEKFKKKIPVYKLDSADKKCWHVFADTHYDVLFHLAYTVLPLHDPSDIGRVMDDNIAGLSNMLALSLMYHVDKVIVLSSYQVYGSRTDKSVQETDEPKPVDLIGQFFMAQEACCAAYRKNGLNVIILRLSEVYGPRQTSYTDQDIQAIINMRLAYQPIVLPAQQPSGKDYIYIGDVVEAMVRTAENATDPVLNISSGQGIPVEGGQGVILDNSRARFLLDWKPRHTFADGIRKTIDWSEKNSRQILQTLAAPAPKSSILQHWLLYYHRTHPEIETLLVFIMMSFAAFMIKTSMGLDLDLLMLYIIIVNLFYGLKQGGVAIALAIAARIAFMFFVDGVRTIDLINNINHVMYLTSYFFVGVSIGYVIDSLHQGKSQMTQEIEKANSDLEFVQSMYQKSLEIKLSLQNMMEYHEDSLIKALSTVGRLEKAESDLVYLEAAKIIAEVLKINSIHVYQMNESNEWLRLMAVIGDEHYGRSIQVSQYPFLDTVVNQHNIYINKSLDHQAPILCVPVVVDGRPFAVIFLDGVDFKKLSQNFINIVKAMSNMLSISLQRRFEHNEMLKPLKYYAKTIILKQEWFARILEIMKNEAVQPAQPFIVMKVDNFVPRYDAFNKKVAGLIRATDYLGEFEQGHLGIILTQLDDRDIPAIVQRFAERGYKLEITNRGEDAV